MSIRSLLLVAALALTAPAAAEPLFQEHFERGENPFGFDGFTASEGSRGERAAGGGERGGVWMTVLEQGSRGGYFGHRLGWNPAWAARGRLHWAAYIRFGFRVGSAEWATSGGSSYELRLPQIGGGGEAQVFGRISRLDDVGMQGRFELVTADGQAHGDAAVQPLMSNRWHLIQFALEDRGGADRVRIWINNSDPAAADYDYIGGDMVNFSGWDERTPIYHGQRLHSPAADARLYYDAITLADDFIPLPLPRVIPPAAPANVTVE